MLVVELKENQLQPMQIDLQWGLSQPAPDGWRGWYLEGRNGNLELRFSNGKFIGLGGGQLPVEGALMLGFAGRRWVIPQLWMQAGGGEGRLRWLDGRGRVWLRAEGYHHYLQPGERELILDAMSVLAGPALLEAVGMKPGDAWHLGRAIVRAWLNAPVPARRGTLACAYPNWHDGAGYLTDVALTNIPNVLQLSQFNGRVVVAPSAELRNVGTADVPWFRKFSTPVGAGYPPPYARDQHPLLTWNMYRIDATGLLRQIGRGELKHAFNTVNYDCSCYAGGSSYEPWNAANPAGYYASILWSANHPDNAAGIGCRDIYYAGTNDYPGFLGLRSEVPAYTVAWEQCGSLFAPDATAPGPCDQIPFNDYAAPDGQRRMLVDPAELGDAASRYLVEAWYLVRDDIDIFNTMGHVDVVPALSGTQWQFPASDFSQGSILDAWVDPQNPGLDASSHTVDNGQGHAGVAVRVLDVGGGVFRWVMALANHDYDPGLTRLELDIDPGFTVLAAGFHDPDDDPANDWTFSQNGQTLRWQAPAGTAQQWGSLYTFWYELAAGPVGRRPMAVARARPESVTDAGFDFNVLMPVQTVFSSTFESPP